MTTTIQLTKPITANGAEVTEIVLRAPTAGELRKVPINKDKPLDMAAHLIMLQCKIPLSSIDDMDGADYMRCNEVVLGFLGNGTGAPPPST